MGRPRTKAKQGLPPNLLVRHRNGVDYYFWRDPRSGKESSLQAQANAPLAIKRAKELNSLVTRERAEEIVRSIADSSSPRLMPFDAWAVHALKKWEDKGMATNTLRSRRSLINSAIRKFGQRPLPSITVRDIAGLLNAYIDEGKRRSAKAMRSVLIDVFRLAHQSGELPHDAPNPATMTESPEVTVKRSRLLLDEFKTIRESARNLATYQGHWIENAMLLALLTGQRREDVGRMQFRRGADWQKQWLAFQADPRRNPTPFPFLEDGHLWVIQGKTGALVRIPLGLRLDTLELSVADVVEKCRSTGAISRYLIHHDRPFGNAPVGNPVHIDTISRQFAAARDATELTWMVAKTPPTFHELRSLSERLYRDQGIDTQTLLGHRSADMTKVYDDLRQADWRTVKIG